MVREGGGAGQVDAQYNLGVAYYNGSCDVNYKKAFEWYEKAAKQGHAEAQHRSGYHVRGWPWHGCELQEGGRVVQEARQSRDT